MNSSIGGFFSFSEKLTIKVCDKNIESCFYLYHICYFIFSLVI